jgi:hypothetical protein
LAPALAFRDGEQESTRERAYVRVVRSDRFPGVPVGVGRFGGVAEQVEDPVAAVGAVVAEGLAGPLAGDEYAPAGVAEVFGPVCFAPAGSRAQAVAGALGLDAVAASGEP